MNSTKNNTASKNTTSRKTIKKDEIYRITPKGLFWLAITDAFDRIDELYDNAEHKLDVAWTLFEAGMKKHGYIEEDQQGNK